MLNMLVVDDNIYFSKVLINKLVQSNKKLRLCMIATDGKEALEIINKEKIDIILLDLKLPEYTGLEILEFIENYKKEELANSIIVISCENDLLLKVINNQLIYSYINKTKSIDEMVSVINRMCQEKEEKNKESKHIEEMKKNTRRKINNELVRLGYNIKYVGTGYLADTIYMLYFSKNRKNLKLEKDIYPIIAKKHNATVNTVKCDIIRATKHIEYDVEELKLKKYFGYFLDRKIHPKLVMNAVLNKIE